MTGKRILISGASIAGLACAYWLRKHGFAVTIVEIASAPRRGGQAVDLRGAGRTVIERMGLLEDARSISLDQAGISWVDERGRARATISSDDFDGEGFISEIEILRGDLVELLHRELDSDVEYLFNDTITGLTQDSDGVEVAFRHAPARRFDLVIGADGLHSAVRAAAFGPEEQFVKPLGLYTAWFTAPAFDDLNGWYQTYNRAGGLVASVRPGRVRTESKAALSFRLRRGETLRHNRHDRLAQVALLDERFADAGWRTPQLLEAARTSSDFSFDAMGQVDLDQWWNGRIALIGDAAACPSPLSGLGTSVALVGAYVLAGELGRGTGHAAAFEGYDRIVRPYAEGAQQLAGGTGGFAPMNDLTIRLVQASMSWATRWPMRGFMQKQFNKSTDIELPHYPRVGLNV
ncbi:MULTISPECIES: FAD-dependent monooxygenase [Kocuria]|uniref:FAD-dependent monooxygenase n=1 Tax=Kocuria TaxID=57493 RepID=UPI0008A318EC|nr:MULTISPECIES: FAD-dependent monooxygenase [Kocuria]OFK08161.1 FAD-binding monooxygenase [Kocuria sp. HMSC066H03]PKZ37382.1 FAD-binding monooxygenase [Kocuria rhizophila]